jgi:hypothetical protein
MSCECFMHLKNHVMTHSLNDLHITVEISRSPWIGGVGFSVNLKFEVSGVRFSNLSLD